MIVSLALALLCILTGTLLTYLYDDGASLSVRVCTGSCVGVAALGLIGFIIASFLGLTPFAILLTAGTLVIASLLVAFDKHRRSSFAQDLKFAAQSIRRFFFHPFRVSILTISFLATAVVLWRVFSRAMFEETDGIYTGVLNNFGDLPFHLSVITSFVFGNNYPPEDPTYAGVKFTYPFLTDFVSAVFVRCGASLRESMFLENIIIALAFTGLLHRLGWITTRDRIAAFLTPILVLLNGGFGFVLLLTKASENERGLLGLLTNLPPSFTVIPETTWRWGNAISTLLIPQRGMLLGLALAVIVFTQWWLTEEKVNEPAKTEKAKKRRKNERPPATALKSARYPQSIKRMVAAGVVAGLLPLVHAHSFVVVMVMGACLALLKRRWFDWLAFFLVASLIALPQMWWSTHGSAVDAGKFFEWQFGWDRGKDNALWFWLKNTGLFIPLVLVAILWRGKEYLVNKRLLLFYLPFTLCFVVPNLVKMAPWVWDNIKVLFYFWLASAALVALLLARLWRYGGLLRVVSVVLLIVITLSGALDVASIALRSGKFRVFDRNGIEFAELIKQQSRARSMIVHAPVHNTPVFLTGRRSLMGYPGHIWTHGLEFAERENQIKRIYAGATDATRLIEQYGIDFAVVGPQERTVMPVNDQFFMSLEKVGEVGEYRLYKTKAP